MTSITTWHRLEPLPRTADLQEGLRAEIADPLWLLARQRQFGEFRGEDAGSPVQATLEAQSARISRYHAGPLRSDAAARSVDHTDASLPLETLVEREPVRRATTGAIATAEIATDGALAVEAGLHFLRLLLHHRAGNRRNLYVQHYALGNDDLPGSDDDIVELRRRASGRVPDGRRLHRDLVAARGSAASLTSLPAEPAVPAADVEKVVAAANDFLIWWDAFLTEPGPADAWLPNRLEHTFAVQADLPEGRVVLVADEYRGGHLDWHAFRAATAPDLGRPAEAVPAERTVRTVLPTPASYGGMPADRFWEIEDASVRFGGLETGRTDLARLLLAEFALTYGNDWFVVPIDLPVGSLCDVTKLTVLDTFGDETAVGPSVNISGPSWRMFQLSAPGAPRRVQRLLFLPPALLQTLESEPVEEVAVFRDEMANVVWGVERTVQGGAGTGVDRYEEQQRLRAGESQQVVTDVGDAELVYRLSTYVPDHWHPFVPVRAAGAPAGSGAIQLERRPIIRVRPDGSSHAVQPKGRILRAAEPLRLEEEEAPRSGAVVRRSFQLTRWTDGRRHVWSGRHKLVGTGEGSSGLRHDAVFPVSP